MALSQVYTAVIGHVITAARWNNEFGNIYANGVDLAFPATKAVSFAGYTVTLDAAGVSTISSTSAQGFILTPGTKSGTPSVNGNSLTVAANTFTDTNTAGSGVAALWSAVSFRAPTLAAANTLVTTTDACNVYIEDPVAGTNETFTETCALYVAGKIKLTGDLRLRGIDSRTNSIVEPFTIQMQTSGTPAAGIGTGMAFVAESADEAPSALGTVDMAFSDVGAGTEDSYMRIQLRRAGAAVAEAYRWTCTNAFSAIWTHANTANRTYTLGDFTARIFGGQIFNGPSSCGSGSTRSHEGTVQISASQALSGVHFYDDFTLDAGDTVTVDNQAGRLCIIATGTITINGTIDAVGAGGPGGTPGNSGDTSPGGPGGPGSSQPGGGGGGGNTSAGGTGGHALPAAGGNGAPKLVAGSQGQNNTGSILGIAHPLSLYGGGGGGGGGYGTGGGASSGGTGGNGGASVVLCAPKVILGAASVLTTTGANGTDGTAGGGGGGGGGAGNVYVFCIEYTDNGATFTMTAGSAGAGHGTGAAGGAGRAGVKQINIYA